RELDYLAIILEWKLHLRREVILAIIYPLMLLAAISGLVILLATVVFPQFASVLSQSTGPIPLPTQILFFLSTVFRLYWWVILLGLLGVAGGFWSWIRTPNGAARSDAFRLRIPVSGNVVRDNA